jgi:transcriptional regulator GlxA family with amidase domain
MWQQEDTVEIAFLLYDDITALDFVGPYGVLSLLPDAEVRLGAVQPKTITCDRGLKIGADTALSEITAPTIVVVPGTTHVARAVDGASPEAAWLRDVAGKAKWLASVCSGSLLLGAAGLLRGKRATTHWLARDMLASFGATSVAERVVVDGNVISSAGVSAGIDMALQLVGLEFGERLAQEIQLRIEYDPRPPFDAGSPERCPRDIVDAAKKALLSRFANATRAAV